MDMRRSGETAIPVDPARHATMGGDTEPDLERHAAIGWDTEPNLERHAATSVNVEALS
jgi:hypothetical protein